MPFVFNPFTGKLDKNDGNTGATGPAGPPVADGDKGDIVVSSSGTVWEIDADVVGPTEPANTTT